MSATIDDLISKSWVISDAQVGYRQQTNPSQNQLIAPTHIPLAVAMIGSNLPVKSQSDWQSKIGIRTRRQADVTRGITLLQSLIDDPTLQPVYTTRSEIVGQHQIKPSTLERFSIVSGSSNPSVTTKSTLIQYNHIAGNWKAEGIALGTESRFFRGLTRSRHHPMQLIQGKFGFAQTPTAKGVAIPIGNGRLELVIVVPTQWDPDALPLEWLSPTAPVDFTDRWITIGIPTFRFQSEPDLTHSLAQTGFKNWIGPDAKGGIQNLQQVNRVDIQFQATPPKSSIKSTRLPFLVDRPFLYAVRDGLSGTYILVGTVVDL